MHICGIICMYMYNKVVAVSGQAVVLTICNMPSQTHLHVQHPSCPGTRQIALRKMFTKNSLQNNWI